MTNDARATLARWHTFLRADAPWIPPQHADVVAALRGLEPGARDALLLSTLDGLSVARIADLLDEAAGTIAYWISSARQRLAPVTANLRDELVAIEAAAPATPVAAPRSRISPIVWIGVPVTIVLVVAMIGVGQLTKRDQPPAAVGASPSVTPTASAPTVAAIEWSEVRFVKDGTIRQLGLAGGRVLALGHLRGSPANAWYSDDGGETWAAGKMDLQPPSEGSTVSFSGMAVQGDRVVAYGEWQTPNQPPDMQPRWKSWASTDRGETWTESEALQPGIATALAGAGGAFLVAGVDVGRGSIMLWRSTDGLNWEEIAPRGFPQFAAHISSLTVLRDTYIAAGVNSAGSRPRIGMWSSPDGRSWDGIEGAPFDAGEMTGITAAPSGLVAVGFTVSSADGRDLKPFLWHSDDGSTWSPVSLGDQPVRPMSVASSPLGTTVLGLSMTGGGLELWFVPADFSKVTTTDFGGSVGVVALPDRFVSGGGCADAACTRSKVVIGLPAASSSEPTP